GQVDDRQLAGAAAQLGMQRGAAHPTHAHVQHQTSRLLRPIGREEGFCAVMALDFEAFGFAQQAEAVAHRGIVVNNEYHGPAHAANGRVKLKHAPASCTDSAQRRPPCDSMMVRLMARPMPSPSGLVVKNGSKMRCRVSVAMPAPLSHTAARAMLPSTLVRIV